MINERDRVTELIMINEGDHVTELISQSYISLFNKLINLKLYSHTLILDRHFAENSEYKDIFEKLAVKNSKIWSEDSLHPIAYYYRTSGVSDCLAQAYVNSIPTLFEEALSFEWPTHSLLHIQCTLLDLLHIPGVCACISEPVLRELLTIIKKQEDRAIIYLETLFIAVSKHKEILELLRQLACRILGNINGLYTVNDRSKIMEVVRNHNALAEHKEDTGRSIIDTPKVPLNVCFFDQLEDLELAELLDKFRKRAWNFE